jgi:hypothetical protein
MTVLAGEGTPRSRGVAAARSAIPLLFRGNTPGPKGA